MREVRVDKEELRNIVQANRDEHRQVFDEAMEAFKKSARKRLENHLEMLTRGETPPLTLGIVVPEDHTDDYDTVLRMLDMEVADDVVLQWDEFRNYVLDEWGWTSRFNETATSYGVLQDRARRR